MAESRPHRLQTSEPVRSGKKSWFSFPRRLKVTREGKYFILITLGVGFAAINTGNNLLYLLLGMLLSLIVVSSVMSELSLRDLTVVRRLPPRAQVNRAHTVEVEVHNHKERVPSYAIEIEDLRAGQPADKRCFFLKISPGSAQVAAYRRTPARRGVDRHVGFRIATRFPFGLFEKSRDLPSDGELIIYPAVEPILLPAKNTSGKLAGHGVLEAGRGHDILTVRPMREGDDVRDIYWRKSVNQLVVLERAREAEQEAKLLIDDQPPSDPPSSAWSQGFEQRIRDVASRAVAHLKRGDRVVVRTSSGESTRVDAALGADPLLRFLALLEPQPTRTDSAPAKPEPGPVSDGPRPLVRRPAS